MTTKIGNTAVSLALLLGCWLSSPTQAGTAFVINPSFESNLDTNDPPQSAGAPMGWPYYSPIDGWNSANGGVNDLVYDAGGPFHNAGTPVPDGQRVGFRQGAGAVSQDITGLTPGKRYWIQFRYDARSGSDLDVAVKFSTTTQGGAMDEQLDFIPKVKPAIGTHSPYYTRTVPFVPDMDSGTLSFEVTARGDSTVLLDAVTIVPRDEGNFAVGNPSFEASGVVFDGASSAGKDWPAISGWAKVGVAGIDDGTGGMADNGATPDQALVVFLEGEGSLTQTLEPLVKGDEYQVQFAYNAKTATTPHLQLKVDGAVVWEKDVTAVGGTKAYATQSVTFKAGSDVAQLSFSNTVAGAVVLLDDVKVLGKTGTRLPPMEMAPAKILVRLGEEGSATITIPAERLSQGTAVVKVRSANTNIFVLPGADASGVQSLTFQGVTSQSFNVKGVGVGSASVEITDSATLLLPTDITTVFVAGSSLILNPSFEMDKDSGTANAPVTGWTTGGANIGMAETGNPFLAIDDLTIPDRTKVLRIQGGGTVSQTVKGLQVGKQYGLQFFYNGRTAGYPYEMGLQVSFGGQQLADIQSIMPAAQNGLTDYYFQEVRFTAAAATGLLEFKTVVASGDATLFLDAVSIVPRVNNEVAVMNSGFEGSTMGANWPGYLQPNRIAGWTCAGGGYGVNAYSPKTFFVEPFFDNGINWDQDYVMFGQGAVSLTQKVPGLTSGKAYTLVFDYNFRDGRPQNSSVTPNTGRVEVSVDGAVVATTEELPPVDTLSPWPGFRQTKPMYQAFVPFTASAETAEIMLKHIDIVGDETFVVDNVRILPSVPTKPAITKELVDQSAKAGDKVTFATTASGSNLAYRWFKDGGLLVDGGPVAGATTATLTLNAIQAADQGDYSVLVSDGVSVLGSSAMLTVESIPVADTKLTASLAAGKVVLTWPEASTGYRLQYATAIPAAAADWKDEVTAPVLNGGNWEVKVDPTGTQRFFRLIQ